jgi:methionyl-tRNA formyltransferase
VVTNALRLIYFGTPDFAVPSLRKLIASPHRVVAVVSQPDRPRGRGQHLTPTATKAVALEHSIPMLQPEKIRTDRFLDDVKGLQADLGVVAAYGKILPETLLQIPRLGMINVHGSLLPRWRGAAPVHRAVIAGDTVTGVTIMRVVKELDAGAMFATVRRPIAPDDTSVDVEKDLAEMGGDLLVRVIDELATGSAKETPQPTEGVTYASKILKTEGLADWSLSATQLHNLIRGLQPWPLVSTRLAGIRILVHRSAVLSETADVAGGTIVRASRDGLDVAGGDGVVLRLLALQPEGRRVMTTSEFLASRRIEAGSRMEAG